MIEKEDFIKKFPLKKHFCVADDKVDETCTLDTDYPYECNQVEFYNVKKKEDCKYWKALQNWEYTEDIWEWIDNYQKIQEKI